MERWNRGRGGVLMVVVVLMLVNSLNAQIYQCYGGCYNKCILSNIRSTPPAQRIPCYFRCILDECTGFPGFPFDFKYSCQVGCYLGFCSLISFDAAVVNQCYGGCSDVCKNI